MAKVSLPLGRITHGCPRCGQPVACGARSGAGSCWCDRLTPAVVPLPAPEARCLCERCLRGLIEEGYRQMIAPLLNTFNLNLGYARKLVADLADEQMVHQPAAGMNHPAWVIGHIANTNNLLLTLLDRESALPEHWQEQFGRGSKPEADASLYPTRDELIAALEFVHAQLADAVKSLPPEQWDDPVPLDRLRERFPTLGSFALYAMSSHESVHLGQLSAWRRMQGLPSVM